MTARPLAGLALLAPAALLGAAFLAQYGFGLSPCELCLWQRWPHAAAIALAAAALLAGPGRPGAALLGLAAAALLAGAGIGGFHAGVELGWWEGLSSCSGAPPAGLSGADFLAALRERPLVRCDEVVWSFLGLSMAGWNALLSAAIAVAAATAARGYASSSASQ